MIANRPLKILMLSLNYAPESVGISVYSTALSQKLAAAGHDVEIVCGKPYYPQWTVYDNYRKGLVKKTSENSVNVTRVAHYVPKIPTGTKRILQQMSFTVSAFLPLMAIALRKKPDLIFVVTPVFISTPIAKLAAILCGSRTWLHVQDFELEAAKATGLLGSDSAISRFAAKVEKFMLRRFDRVSSISPAMCTALATKGVELKRIFEFRNWSTAPQESSNIEKSRYRAEFGIGDAHVILYAGTIANKQGLEVLVDAAEILKYRKDIVFILCGEGPNRAKLESQTANSQNIKFFPLQPIDRLGELLSLATVHALPQIAGIGDLVLPSKLANMLQSGRPVIACCWENTGLAAEIKDCGLRVDPENADELAGAIEQLVDNKMLREKFSTNAKRRAEAVWSFGKIFDRFETEICQLCLTSAETKTPVE
jgi:colanic acid biosynthesis glycosyl transferase WcaI